jgi:hypothetical protein
MPRLLACPSLVLATVLFLVFPAPDALAEIRAECGTPAPDALVTSLMRQAPGLKPNVLRLALDANACAAQRGLVKRQELLTVIDYSIPSDEPRLFTFDLASRKLLFRELVAHGKNSGGNLPDTFSNVHGSLATSLGLFVTAGTYVGSNGYSLKLRGLEKGVNDNAWDRLIVMHGAPYVNPGIVRTLGRLGRSWGCPAVRTEIARKMIDTIKGGSAIFAYYPDSHWLSTSAFLSQTTRVAEGNAAGGQGSSAARR